jgi:hypothetical protein
VAVERGNVENGETHTCFLRALTSGFRNVSTSSSIHFSAALPASRPSRALNHRSARSAPERPPRVALHQPPGLDPVLDQRAQLVHRVARLQQAWRWNSGSLMSICRNDAMVRLAALVRLRRKVGPAGLLLFALRCPASALDKDASDRKARPAGFEPATPRFRRSVYAGGRQTLRRAKPRTHRETRAVPPHVPLRTEGVVN